MNKVILIVMMAIVMLTVPMSRIVIVTVLLGGFFLYLEKQSVAPLLQKLHSETDTERLDKFGVYAPDTIEVCKDLLSKFRENLKDNKKTSWEKAKMERREFLNQLLSVSMSMTGEPLEGNLIKFIEELDTKTRRELDKAYESIGEIMVEKPGEPLAYNELVGDEIIV